MGNKKIYNKLVRDKIPEIIKNNGQIPEIKVLDDLAFLEMLDKKLIEECEELVEAVGKDLKVSEMADIIEVLYAMADNMGVSVKEIENARCTKREQRGAFEKKILLISTEEV